MRFSFFTAFFALSALLHAEIGDMQLTEIATEATYDPTAIDLTEPITESVPEKAVEEPNGEITDGENTGVAVELDSKPAEDTAKDLPESKQTGAIAGNGDEAESADSENDSPDSNAEDVAEMSQEEADAELAASTVDSATVDSLRPLILDMTTAFMPSESRRIASIYGIRTYRMHRGVDLGLCHGENRTIVAAFAGTVKLVRNQGRRRGYGKYVVIDHGNGLTTLYAHLAKWTVSIGDTVMAGDTIGIGGNTGRSFGAHLHFEMKYKGKYINPATVFNFPEGTFYAANTEIDPVKLQSEEDAFQKELSKHRYYKVRRGDCLGKIARKYGISIKRLKQLNNIKGNMIRPGQVLRCS